MVDKERARGWFFNLYVLVGMAISFIAMMLAFFYTRAIVHAVYLLGFHTPVEQSTLYMISGMGAVCFASFVGLWMWKKWAVYCLAMVMATIVAYIYQTTSISLLILLSLFMLVILPSSILFRKS